MAVISVAGLMTGRKVGGLKQSMKEFREHHAKTADALLNVSGVGTVTGEPVDEEDARMEYVHEAWPSMVYHAAKGEAVAFNRKELDELLRSGYRDTPYPKPQIAIYDPHVEKQKLVDSLQKKDGEIAQLNDVLQKALARLDSLEATQFDKKKAARSAE